MLCSGVFMQECTVSVTCSFFGGCLWIWAFLTTSGQESAWSRLSAWLESRARLGQTCQIGTRYYSNQTRLCLALSQHRITSKRNPNPTPMKAMKSIAWRTLHLLYDVPYHYRAHFLPPRVSLLKSFLQFSFFL